MGVRKRSIVPKFFPPGVFGSGKSDMPATTEVAAQAGGRLGVDAEVAAQLVAPLPAVDGLDELCRSAKRFRTSEHGRLDFLGFDVLVE